MAPLKGLARMITIEGVSHTYPQASQPSLRDVTLSLQEGVALGLLGPNGAGKTTLMSLLAGLQPVQSGRIAWNGTPLHQLSKAQRQRMALVPQDFAFYPLLSVWDNLKFFAALYQVRNTGHLQQLLRQTGLQDHQHKLAKHLSGGLKRRLNFAIGLINQPHIIFLDEITVGIDPESRQFILDSVATLSRQGVTVIYTSHYLQEIELLCPQLALLHQGRLVYQGDVQEILQTHGDHTLVLGTTPTMRDADVAALGGVRLADGLVRIPTAQVEPVLERVRQMPYQLHTCRFGHQSLESFYLQFLREQAASSC